MSELTASLSRIETKLDAVEIDLNYVRGRISGLEGPLSQFPTSLQLLATFVATCAAGAAITAAVIRFMPT
jgi:hypothetical protein